MVELVLDKLLNRYLLMGLRANLSVVESVTKCKQVNTTLAPVFSLTKLSSFQMVELLPSWWLQQTAPELKKLSMFSKFIGTLGSSPGLARDAVIETARLVRILGDFETGEKLRELLY